MLILAGSPYPEAVLLQNIIPEKCDFFDGADA
jgi:hypothetical protein